MSTNQKPVRNSCWCRRTISRKRRRTRLRATAFPRRREVINPARDGREFSAGATQSVSSLPCRVKPSRFTRSYSDACVRRRAFGNENEPVICISPDCTAGSLLPRSRSGEDPKKRTTPEFTNSAGTEQAIQQETQLQREIPLPRQDLFQSSLRAEWWGLELSPERRFRSFAHTPRGARHRPGCRCIFS